MDSDIQGPVDIHPDARVKSSVVRGPVVIGAGAQITDAYIGPYTSIAERVEVAGAEVEHSMILAGARIQHLRDRLEASIVGPNARVYREFRLPRGLRLEVGRSAEVSLN